MAFLESCREVFSTDNLYSIFKVEKDASDAAIKKAYWKLSLEIHPDRVSSEHKDLATTKFQIISRIYCLLSEAETRKIYDETGVVDEENVNTQDRDWEEYWRLMYPKINVQNIKAFERTYKGSADEHNDLKTAYITYEGDMDKIMDSVLCAEINDEDRFRKILEDLIMQKDVPKFDAFTKEKKSKKNARKRRAEQEAVEAEQHARDLGIDPCSSLQAMIKKCQESRASQADSFLDKLAEKYGKTQKKTETRKKKK